MGENKLWHFQAYPKTPRLFRDCVVTEKIDGTNGSVVIMEVRTEDQEAWEVVNGVPIAYVATDAGKFALFAASKSRYLGLGKKDDNFGFANYVLQNCHELVKLGPGRHAGEWWGQGIQRGYGLTERRWSLFNTTRWAEWSQPACCHVVPVLHRGPFNTEIIRDVLDALGRKGSAAAPGFMKPEGIVVYHDAAQMMFKATLENDEGKHGRE